MTVNLHLNWELLRDQKRALLECMKEYGDHPLDGLLELIDYLQDVGEQIGEPVVYLED